MLLRKRSNGHMLEVVNVQDLFNVLHEDVDARDQVGEECQDSESFRKADLVFLSGEELPR